MKEKLKKMLAAKEARKAELATKSNACEDIATLRSINTELDGVNEEIRQLNAMIDAVPDTNVDERTSAVNAGIPAVVTAGVQKPAERSNDKYATEEYRKAFMAYTQRGTAIPPEFAPERRGDEYTSTTEAAAVIPTTILNEVIREIKKYGQLYGRVRHLAIQGGVSIPISSVVPTATWITEAAPAERDKLGFATALSFSYFGLECKIATSLLASIVSLPIYESTLTALISEAMIKALEVGIVKGAGTTEMTGIVTDATIAAAAVTLTSSEFAQWDSWKKKVFAKLGLGYKAGATFIMANGTFESYIDGMVDANGQPIGRVNYGITEGSQERFGGKEVILVEDDIIANYDDASVGDIVAIFGDLNKYAINSNMQLTMYRYLDQDKNQWVDKAILIADGKVLDTHAFLIVKKGA